MCPCICFTPTPCLTGVLYDLTNEQLRVTAPAAKGEFSSPMPTLWYTELLRAPPCRHHNKICSRFFYPSCLINVLYDLTSKHVREEKKTI